MQDWKVILQTWKSYYAHLQTWSARQWLLQKCHFQCSCRSDRLHLRARESGSLLKNIMVFYAFDCHLSQCNESEFALLISALLLDNRCSRRCRELGGDGGNEPNEWIGIEETRRGYHRERSEGWEDDPYGAFEDWRRPAFRPPTNSFIETKSALLSSRRKKHHGNMWIQGR